MSKLIPIQPVWLSLWPFRKLIQFGFRWVAYSIESLQP